GAVLPRGMGDGRQARLGRELLVGREASAIVAEFGEDLRGVDGAAARQTLHEQSVGMVRQRGLDGGGELLDVRDERRGGRGEGAARGGGGGGGGGRGLLRHWRRRPRRQPGWWARDAGGRGARPPSGAHSRHAGRGTGRAVFRPGARRCRAWGSA